MRERWVDWIWKSLQNKTGGKNETLDDTEPQTARTESETNIKSCKLQENWM